MPFRINELQLIKFIDIQFKKFRSGLKFEPIVFFDLSPKSFEQFARKNLLDCQEIHKLILSRAKSFVLKVFYQRRWYQNNPDQLIKNTEDIVGDAIVGFYELISKRYIANPVGLLNTICYRRVVDHFKKYRVKEEIKTGFAEAASGGNLCAEIPMNGKEVLLNITGEGCNFIYGFIGYTKSHRAGVSE